MDKVDVDNLGIVIPDKDETIAELMSAGYDRKSAETRYMLMCDALVEHEVILHGMAEARKKVRKTDGGVRKTDGTVRKSDGIHAQNRP